MRSAALCLLVSAFACADDRKPKYVHTSNEHGFTVGLPGKPKLEPTKLTTVAGTLNVHTTRYDSGSELVLSVTVCDYPKDFAKVPPEKVFEGVVGEMKGADGKVIEEKEITLGAEKYPGRQWRIEAGKSVIRVQVYLVGSRLYQVMANGSKSGVSGTAAEDLFKTFELLK
jgi:hypothetical protein